MIIEFVIKELENQLYLKDKNQFTTDIYMSKRFIDYGSAEDYIKQVLTSGTFKIEKIYIR